MCALTISYSGPSPKGPEIIKKYGYHIVKTLAMKSMGNPLFKRFSGLSIVIIIARAFTSKLLNYVNSSV